MSANRGDRSRLATLAAARDGTLNYIPSADLWTIEGRLIDYSTIDLDPAEPERCRDGGLVITVFDGWDHYRGILTGRGREVLSLLDRPEAAPTERDAP